MFDENTCCERCGYRLPVLPPLGAAGRPIEPRPELPRTTCPACRLVHVARGAMWIAVAEPRDEDPLGEDPQAVPRASC